MILKQSPNDPSNHQLKYKVIGRWIDNYYSKVEYFTHFRIWNHKPRDSNLVYVFCDSSGDTLIPDDWIHKAEYCPICNIGDTGCIDNRKTSGG